MQRTLAQQLLADPRLAQVRQLLHELVADHQQDITAVRHAAPDAVTEYHKQLEHFAKIRAGVLYYPYLGSGIGRGPFVELADGSVKYDMIGGIGVHALGHSHPTLLDAAIDAAVRDTVMQGNLQQNTESVALADQLVRIAQQFGSSLTHCFLTTSGAMANENALKLVFHTRYPADRLLAFDHCFMGRTLALAQITDRPRYRANLPTTLAVDYVPFFDAAAPEVSTQRAVHTLHEHIARYPGRHAAMCFELIQGEGGYYPGDRDFFLALINVLHQHNIAVLVDEVQTFGRTTQPFAFQHFKLDDYVELVTVGKLSHVCATLFTDAFAPSPGLISQTFTAATASIFAATAILRTLCDGDYFGPTGRIMAIHNQFVTHLQAIADRQPGRLRGPFGIGSMIAFEVFDGHADQTRYFLQKLYENGVIAFVAGSRPARVRFLPPVAAVTDQDIATICTIVEQTLADVAPSFEGKAENAGHSSG